MSHKKALIMAGGTGGHIFPGLALAKELIDHGWQVEWMGTADRMEADLVPKHGLKIHFINIKGIRGNGLLRKLALPLTLINAYRQAKQVIKSFQPEVVVGFGGYASGPGGLAARSLGIPLVIHEQNAVLGMTNRWLSKVAHKTFLAFDLVAGQKPDFEVIGNPVRADIVALGKETKRLLNDTDEIRILVVGGSLGAKVFNDDLAKLFVQAVAQSTKKLVVRHQCGKHNLQKVSQCYQDEIGDSDQVFVDVEEFIDDMTTALRWCDLVVCRAGALTVSELAASGNAGIFIPLPHAVDDHQTANAKWLVAQGAGQLVPQSDISTLTETLGRLLSHPEQINEMQTNARLVANNEATQKLFALCQNLEISN